MPSQKTISVFEHQILRTDKGNVSFSENQLKALQSYYGSGVPYFSLTNNGIQFNEYVGVIQVGSTLIEVLPKADKYSDDKETWRSLLIGMLRTVSGFEIRSTSSANLKIRQNTILDIYFELFIKEVELLIYRGLIKKYRKKEGNNTALRGNIIFSKQLQNNITHQERFYTRFTNYDTAHILHQILYKTISILNRINKNTSLNSRISSLLLNFPEMPDIKVNESYFSKIVFNRKSQVYKKAIGIAQMILLQYHPDVSRGKNDVLALMFDMNKLWEKFVLSSLIKNNSTKYSITSQTNKNFWKPKSGRISTIKPDILINKGGNEYFVLDTKWKTIKDSNPSPEDLRQIFVYNHYYNTKKGALVYPGKFESRNGMYFDPNGSISNKTCSIIALEENKDIKKWQKDIFIKIENWISE